MRLSAKQRDLITAVLHEKFGAASQIWLFGSRVDDTRRGGDIDLYIEPELQDPEALVDARIAALVELHQHLGEQKIDLVIKRKQAPMQLIHRVARSEGVHL